VTDVAVQITPLWARDPRPISNSEVAVFKRCRRRWWLSQFRGLTPLRQAATGPAALGTRIHTHLALYYDPAQELTVEDVLGLWENDTIELYASYPGDTDLPGESELGRIMLEGYFEWLAAEGADSDLEIVSAERSVSLPVLDWNGPRPVTLVGKTDMQVRRRSNNARLFVDHKSVGNLADLPKIADIAEQFLHYGVLELMEHLQTVGTLEGASFADGGMYNMLRKVKRTARANPPFYGRHEVRHNRDVLRSYWVRLLGEIAEIQRAEDRLLAGEDHRAVAYPTPTKDCSWDCQFRAVCPMLDDPTAHAELFLAEAYTIGDPLTRYEKKGEEHAA
jgi:hypothetical protein